MRKSNERLGNTAATAKPTATRLCSKDKRAEEPAVRHGDRARQREEEAGVREGDEDEADGRAQAALRDREDGRFKGSRGQAKCRQVVRAQ